MIDAGRRLGAQWVLGGGYQHVAERLRLTAQLVHVDTAHVVYTAKVDGVIGDLFELQDRLVAALTGGAPAPAPAVDATLPASSPQPAGGSGFAPAAMGFIDGPAPPAPPETITRDELGRATMRAVRIAEPLSLDGELDEPIYDRVPAVSGFIQQLPDEGAAATEKTEAWVFFDEEHVFVAARLWDSAPEDQWVANDMRRDAFQIIFNDNFQVVFDTFYDRRNAVAFMVNPIGGFFDFEISDEGNPNVDWNPVWDVRTGRFEQGWTVEMQIPSSRYAIDRQEPSSGACSSRAECGGKTRRPT